jgi:hypothetical protein
VFGAIGPNVRGTYGTFAGYGMDTCITGLKVDSCQYQGIVGTAAASARRPEP